LVFTFTENINEQAYSTSSKKSNAHEHFAAAEDQKEDPGLGQLIQHALDLGGGHFAMIVMIQIASARSARYSGK
jgi:hypothetical protein